MRDPHIPRGAAARHAHAMRFSARRGFTLMEIMIAMTLMLVILGIGTNFFRRQGNLIAAQSGRLEAQQTAQFTLSELDRELRLAGVGVADMQPTLVQADAMAMTFNADLVSIVLGDPSAVYVDTAADGAMSMAFRSGDKKFLPNSTFTYPESTHMRAPGAPSGAETVSFWLSPDSTAGASEYVLWRRVNAGQPKLVAKGILKRASDTLFQYFKPDSLGTLIPIPGSVLPLYHNAKTHGMPSDTGKFALVDSVYSVRVRMTVVFHGAKGDVTRRLDSTIRLMNAGLIRRTTCGEPPLPVFPSAVYSVDASGAPRVTITWTRSGDEGGGEKDVERYALYRRPAATAATMDEPFASVPAGSAFYSFVDTDVKSGEQWVYGAAAQDCTPTTSSVNTTATVTIP